MFRRYILGVDPGLSGALAFICMDTKRIIDIVDMPITKTKKKNKIIREINVSELSIVMDSFSRCTEYALFEKVGAAPNQGLSSTFKFGYVTGLIVGLVAANYISHGFITPAVWKADLGLDRDKDKSRELAMKLWPQKKDLFMRKKDDGRAEAALIAYVGLKHAIK